jgi:DNA-binding MarR family transcriptional regulator
MRFRRHDSSLPGLKKTITRFWACMHQHNYLISSDIGRMMDVEKGSLTILIDQLEERGLIRRRVDPVTEENCTIIE